MKKEDEIPSLTDSKWANVKELGQIEEIWEYQTGEGKKKVKAVAFIVSGEELKEIEHKFVKMNLDTEQVDMDADGYEIARLARIYHMDAESVKAIFTNKSSELRQKMVALANKVSGYETKKVKQEKNSDSPTP